MARTRREQSTFGRGAEAGRRQMAAKRAEGKLSTVRRVIEFPKPVTPEDLVSHTIVFDIGGDRFAMKWTAEIERLPPAGPVVFEPRPGAEMRPFASRETAEMEQNIQNVRRSRRGSNRVTATEQKGAGD